MGRALKTKDVAEALGVSSRTIQRWVRNYNVPYQTNAKGHFQFTEQHVKLLEKIRDQISSQSATASPQVKPQVKEEETKKLRRLNLRTRKSPQNSPKWKNGLMIWRRSFLTKRIRWFMNRCWAIAGNWNT